MIHRIAIFWTTATYIFSISLTTKAFPIQSAIEKRIAASLTLALTVDDGLETTVPMSASRNSKQSMSQSIPFLKCPPILAENANVPGNVGFDPLGFVKDKDDLIAYQEAEIKHARLAMLAVVGWPLSELWNVKLAEIWNLPTIIAEDDRVPAILNSNIWSVSPIFWGFCLGASAAIDTHAILKSRDESDTTYFPGNLRFDPLGLLPADRDGQQRMRLAEIKNGRLSMVAISGFAIQEFISKVVSRSFDDVTYTIPLTSSSSNGNNKTVNPILDCNMKQPYVTTIHVLIGLALCLIKIEAYSITHRIVRHENVKTRFALMAPNCILAASPSKQISMHSINSQEVIASLLSSSGTVPIFQAFAINVILFNIARKKLLSALTPSGYVHAMGLGTMLWATLGWKGWMYCVLYLILGQVVTKIGFATKEQRGIAESRGGRRGPENVWGSAATSLICAILYAREWIILDVNRSHLLVGYVAALATKLADTFASEIGKAYGKTTFLITTLERVKPGTEGAISAEGTAAAILGGFLLSMCGYGLGLITLPAVVISTIAAFIATNAESVIGATLQGKQGFKFMTNEVVNFLNTLIGGVIAIIASKFLL